MSNIPQARKELNEVAQHLRKYDMKQTAKQIEEIIHNYMHRQRTSLVSDKCQGTLEMFDE